MCHQDQENMNTIFDLLSTVSTHSRERGAILDHHLNNQLTDTWMKKPSQPQSYIQLQVSRVQGQFGLTPAYQQTVIVHAMADTVYHSCLVGIRIVCKLGLHRCNLIPIKMEMHVATTISISLSQLY